MYLYESIKSAAIHFPSEYLGDVEWKILGAFEDIGATPHLLFRSHQDKMKYLTFMIFVSEALKS